MRLIPIAVVEDYGHFVATVVLNCSLSIVVASRHDLIFAILLFDRMFFAGNGRCCGSNFGHITTLVLERRGYLRVVLCVVLVFVTKLGLVVIRRVGILFEKCVEGIPAKSFDPMPIFLHGVAHFFGLPVLHSCDELVTLADDAHKVSRLRLTNAVDARECLVLPCVIPPQINRDHPVSFRQVESFAGTS